MSRASHGGGPLRRPAADRFSIPDIQDAGVSLQSPERVCLRRLRTSRRMAPVAPRRPRRPPRSRTGADCGRTSFRGRGGRRGPQRTEGGAEFGGKECRLLPRGKMRAFRMALVVDQLGIGILGPLPRNRADLLRESAYHDRDRVLRGKNGSHSPNTTELTKPPRWSASTA